MSPNKAPALLAYPSATRGLDAEAPPSSHLQMEFWIGASSSLVKILCGFPGNGFLFLKRGKAPRRGEKTR